MMNNKNDFKMLNKYSDDYYVEVLRKVYPDKNVEIVAYDDSGYCYEWDIAVVYKVYENDVYYLGSDSGCSCNFYGDNEDYNDLMQFSSRRSLLSYLRNSKEDKIRSLHSEVLQNK